MFNIGGAEVLVILVVALLVLGPEKLPEAAREFGRFTSSVRQMARGFQRELESVKSELTEAEARAAGAAAVAANPGPRGNLGPLAGEPTTPTETSTAADRTDDGASAAPSTSAQPPAPAPADQSSRVGEAGSDAAPSAAAGDDTTTDATAGPVRPGFDASAQPDRTEKPVSAVPQAAVPDAADSSTVESRRDTPGAATGADGEADRLRSSIPPGEL